LKELESITVPFIDFIWVKKMKNKTVYMCFFSDVIYSTHIAMIEKAKELGNLIIGVLSGEVVINYKNLSLVSYVDRKHMLESIKGVYKVVEQKHLVIKRV